MLRVLEVVLHTTDNCGALRGTWCVAASVDGIANSIVVPTLSDAPLSTVSGLKEKESLASLPCSPREQQSKPPSVLLTQKKTSERARP